MFVTTIRAVSASVLIALLGACNNSPSNSFTGHNNVMQPPVSLPGDNYISPSFEIRSAAVKYEPVLDSFLFTIEAMDNVASVVPTPAGQVNGAPVLGYVFTTNLSPADIGYQHVEGTVALAITSHPDFDDTPLWDENNNQAYDDDGVLYHSHWVVLEQNELATEKLAVVQAKDTDVLTPTSPMPMYLDSPGFTILEKTEKLHVIVPANAINRRNSFTANALTAYLEVDANGEAPLLKVERIYDSFSSILEVTGTETMPQSNWPDITVAGDEGTLKLNDASVDYVAEIDSLIFSIYTQGNAATKTVTSNGQVDGASVLGYVFPTTLSPEQVGFKNISGATLALAVTTHPDFDDTPLWDENNNNNYGDDGKVYHTHWVALVSDEESQAGLSVPSANTANLPPTSPMPMYIDSPNFHAFAQDNLLRIIVPTQRVNNITTFNFDSVTAGMNVDLSGVGPVLRVNTVHDILSGDLSLPYSVTPKQLTDY
ncbi:hypothetical protein [Flocculibacter collagenilyticus]|uniref:hypothetical protein n=1 Tax=Flocculibacter collagenilyticus TaxID=2744479 RepID=UPI0018F3AD3B|nr:hypothetical protein [Flocculibacter collagenilyticus]